MRLVDRPVLFEALLDAVEEAAGDAATLWILDDLQWADDSTWEFVRYMARRVADLALVLAVTYREEEIGPAHPWWPGLVQLKREPSVLRLPLGRLSAADGERIARAVDPALPADTVAMIVERGAGTALLVEELASLASRPGRLLLVPDIVRATVRERAGRLDPRGRAVLEVAAVAGLEEAAYQEVPTERRRALHEQIAAAMAKSSIHLTERVAVHLEQAGRPEAALSVLETAAEEANRAGQVGRVATLHLGAFQLARRHQSLASQRARLEDRAIEDLSQADRLSELEPLVREAWPRRGARPPAERAQLAAVFSTCLFWTGSVVEALAVVTDELASLEEGGGIDSGADLLRQAALIAWFKGDGPAALALADRALDVARRTGDLDAQLRARRLQIVIVYGQDRDRAAAVSRLRENAALARAHCLAVHEGRTDAYLSFVTGRLQDAESAREETERIGAWFWVALLFEAGLQLMEGRRDVSEAIFGQIRRELRLGTGTIAAWVAAKEACLYLHRGDLDEARNLLDGPSATADACSYGLVAAERSAAQGWLAWEQGRLQEACAHLASAGADNVIETYATMSAGPAFVALRLDALLRLGRAEEAAAAISGFAAFDLGYD